MKHKQLYIDMKLRTLMLFLLAAFTLTVWADKSANLRNYLYNNVYTSRVTSVKVTGTQVSVEGVVDGEDGSYVLVEATPADNVTEDTAFAHRTALTGKKFKVTLSRYASYDGYNYDRALSKWAIASTLGGRDSLVSYARYADEVAAISSPAALKPVSKKGVGAGLGDTYMHDLDSLDAKNITCNIVITTLIAQSPIFAHSVEYSYGGKTYYIDGGAIAEWDRHLTYYQQRDIAVSAIILVTPSASDGTLSHVFCHPDYNGGYYSMPNMTTMESINAYAAILNYLASRYNGSGHGRIEHWIMHNEVDMGTTWTNMGSPAEPVYIDEYVKSMRLCYNIVRQYDQHAFILGSYTHDWTVGAGGYSCKNMLEQTVQYSTREGDFHWGVAAHPYPQDLSKPEFWKNDKQSTGSQNSPYVTFKNLEVINEWILDPAHFYNGSEKRALFLSENGTNSPSYSDKDLALQAAGACWAWKKANALKGIDAIMWHNWMDNRVEDGLRIGLHFFPDDETHPGGRKPVWHVWRAAGTALEDSIMNPYMGMMGLGSWNDIFLLVEASGRTFVPNYSYVMEAEDYDQGGRGVAYDGRMETAGSAYRTDVDGVSLEQRSTASNGWDIADMGAAWNSYDLGKWVDADKRIISRAMAQENWGSWFTYSFEAAAHIVADIYVHFGQAWGKYGKAAGKGWAPSDSTYRIEHEPSLNWPRHYAGAVVVSLDGVNLITTQTARPLVPETFQARGTNFNTIAADKSKWTSTLTGGALSTDTLWLWSKANVNGSLVYNQEPDYSRVHLAPGQHVLKIASLCGAWTFDCIKVDCYQPTGVTTVERAVPSRLKAWGGMGAVHVESDKPARVFSITGRLMGTTASALQVPAGIYIVTTGSEHKKVMVR